MLSDNEQANQELVKCVVVGDTAVGKTRLICARACNKQVSLSQLLTTHVPTVWAIDQYRIYKDVLERSWNVVDGAHVSLRLWDTFGDHEKDRRFAYGRSDVVLLCFSLTSKVSLRNCKSMWLAEIRRFCPTTPVILVGCKNDLRFLYRDDTYLSLFRDHSPFLRATQKCDLIMPDEARSVARDLGIPYYETSVFTYHGVNDVFENAIRIALLARRQQRFWITNLKKVQQPMLQEPYCPPKPRPHLISVQVSSYQEHMSRLYTQQSFTDVIFIVASVGFSAHRFILYAASVSFQDLFIEEDCVLGSGEMGRSASESSMVSTFGEATLAEFNEDTEHLIRNGCQTDRQSFCRTNDFKRQSSCQILSWTNCYQENEFNIIPHTNCVSKFRVSQREERIKRCQVARELIVNHPAVTSVRMQQCEGLDSRGHKSTSIQTIITLNELITPRAFQHTLHFLYTGSLDGLLEPQPGSKGYSKRMSLLSEIRQVCEFLHLPELLAILNNIIGHQEYLNAEFVQRYKINFKLRLQELILSRGLFSDILFQLEDGSFPLHRALLMSRCEMFQAMFSGDFREGSAKVIFFPDIRADTLQILLCYLYTDELTSGLSLNPNKCVDILELANRLCLQRLTNLLEKRLVEQLKCYGCDELIPLCLKLLEPAKFHNANQLAAWCMNYLCVNYNRLCKCKTSAKLLKSLHVENQEYLAEHRWPPVWYLKEHDFYEKCVTERERMDKALLKNSGVTISPSTSGGCLCFQKSSTSHAAVISQHHGMTSQHHVMTSHHFVTSQPGS